MVQFHDGQEMRLRSHVHAASPHPGEGGEGATPGSSGVPPVRIYHGDGPLCITSRTSTAPPAEHHVRLRNRTHAAFPHPREGATPNGPLPADIYQGNPMCASASDGRYLAAAPAEGHGYDEPPQAATVDNNSMPVSWPCPPLPFFVAVVGQFGVRFLLAAVSCRSLVTPIAIFSCEFCAWFLGV